MAILRWFSWEGRLNDTGSYKAILTVTTLRSTFKRTPLCTKHYKPKIGLKWVLKLENVDRGLDCRFCHSRFERRHIECILHELKVARHWCSFCVRWRCWWCCICGCCGVVVVVVVVVIAQQPRSRWAKDWKLLRRGRQEPPSCKRRSRLRSRWWSGPRWPRAGTRCRGSAARREKRWSRRLATKNAVLVMLQLWLIRGSNQGNFASVVTCLRPDIQFSPIKGL